MSTLFVTTATNYSSTSIATVSAITFLNLSSTSATATFVASQFTSMFSYPGVTFSAGNNRIVINDCTNIS